MQKMRMGMHDLPSWELRMLMVGSARSITRSLFTLLVNLADELRRRVPASK